jgi:hypothetical protein
MVAEPEDSTVLIPKPNLYQLYLHPILIFYLPKIVHLILHLTSGLLREFPHQNYVRRTCSLLHCPRHVISQSSLLDFISLHKSGLCSMLLYLQSAIYNESGSSRKTPHILLAATRIYGEQKVSLPSQLK